jgi:hypothetical protein
MRASELIRQLADAISTVGDLDVVLLMPQIGFRDDYRVGLPQHYLSLDDFFENGERIVIDYDTGELEKFSDGDWLGSELEEGWPEIAGEKASDVGGGGNDGYMAETTECGNIYDFDFDFDFDCGGDCLLGPPPTREARFIEDPWDDDTHVFDFPHCSSTREKFDPRHEC